MASLEAIEQRVRVCEKRLDKVEKVAESINKVNLSLQKLTITTDNLVEVVKTQNQRLKAIEEKPIQDFEKLKSGALTKIGSVIGGAIILVLVVVIIWLSLK